MSSRCALWLLVAALGLSAWVAAAPAVTVPQALPLSQDWSDTGLIAADDDWSAVLGIVGYRGDDLTQEAGTDPQTVVADGSGTPIDVIANQAHPDSLFAGGIAEFELANPVVALQPSATADSPHLLISLDTSGREGIMVSYKLRDLDGSGDDALQPVALQYRVGLEGSFVNLPSAFVPDATAGPGLATQVTQVLVPLPADAADRPVVQLRFVTTNASGADEWVGIDDLSVAGTPLIAAPAPAPPALDTSAPSLTVHVALRYKLLHALRHGLAARATVDEPAAIRSELRLRPRLARRLRLPIVVGRETSALTGAGTSRLVTKFSARAKRRLTRLHLIRITLRTRATDAAGNSWTSERTVRLVR